MPELDTSSTNLSPPLHQSTNPESDPHRLLATQIARLASPPDTPGSVSPLPGDFKALTLGQAMSGKQVGEQDNNDHGVEQGGEAQEKVTKREREHSFGGDLEDLKRDQVSTSEEAPSEVDEVEGGVSEPSSETIEASASHAAPDGPSTFPESSSLESMASSSDTADTSEGPRTPKPNGYSTDTTPRIVTASTFGSLDSINGLGVYGQGGELSNGGTIEKAMSAEGEAVRALGSTSHSPTPTSSMTPGRRSPKPSGSTPTLAAPLITPRRLSQGSTLNVPTPNQDGSNGQPGLSSNKRPISPSPRRSLGVRSPDKSEFNSSAFVTDPVSADGMSLGPSVATPRKSSEARRTGTIKSPTPAATSVFASTISSSYPPEKQSVIRKESHPSLSNDPYALPSTNLGPNAYPLEKSTYTPYTPIDSPISPHIHHPLTSVPTTATVKPGITDSTAYWLLLYFAFTLSLTLFNKLVLNGFPFPWTLTGLHALSGTVGCYIALERGQFVPARLTSRETLTLGAFSMLYTINIAVSSMSAALVTVPFHQVVRSTTPLFTIIISATFFKGKFGVRKLISLLPVVAGVGFATYGDIYFTAWGLILTLLGTSLAALKTVITNVIQTGGGGRLRLHPLDLLMRMSPLAFIQCVIGAYLSGELERVREFGALKMTRGKAGALLINGVIAFGLNIVSFTANKKAGPLTMTVSANCKQVLTIVLSVVMFNIPIAPMNALGILLTLFGGGWYAYIEYVESSVKRLGRIMEKP